MASDNGKEKKILGKKPMPMSKKIKKEISSQEETEDEEEEVFSEIGSEIESDEDYDTEGSGRSDSETSWIDDKVNAKSTVPKPLATKRQTVKDVVKKSPTKRKIVEKKPKECEKPSKVAKVTTSTGKKKPELPPFTDKDVDIDLYHASPTNVVPVKIKVSNNLIVSCRNVDQAESKNITYDYAAITIQKKTGNDKMFEFIMPLSLTPRIISALKLIIRENTKFFEPETLEDIPIRN